MGRIITTESAGKDRSRLVRSVVVAIRALMVQQSPDRESRDLAAYIALALQSIHETIEPSVAAWEKKGYWVKADRFRLEWEWSGKLAEKMRQAVLTGDWAGVASAAAQAGTRFASVEVPANHRLGTPWTGAFEVLKKAV